MAEVTDFFGCKGTLAGAELKLCVSKTLEDLSEAGEVLFPADGEGDDVVQVEEAGLPVEACQDAVHEPGKCRGSVAEAKGDLVKFKQLAAAGAEGCLLFIPFLDSDLPVPTF